MKLDNPFQPHQLTAGREVRHTCGVHHRKRGARIGRYLLLVTQESSSFQTARPPELDPAHLR